MGMRSLLPERECGLPAVDWVRVVPHVDGPCTGYERYGESRTSAPTPPKPLIVFPILHCPDEGE